MLIAGLVNEVGPSVASGYSKDHLRQSLLLFRFYNAHKIGQSTKIHSLSFFRDHPEAVVVIRPEVALPQRNRGRSEHCHLPFVQIQSRVQPV